MSYEEPKIESKKSVELMNSDWRIILDLLHEAISKETDDEELEELQNLKKKIEQRLDQ